MKRKRFTEPQIVFALRQAESGTAVDEIMGQLNVTSAIHALRRLLVNFYMGKSGARFYGNGNREGIQSVFYQYF